MQTKLSINYSQYVISADKDHEHAIKLLISGIATGSITLELVSNCYPDQGLFVDTKGENYLDHKWEELLIQTPHFERFDGLKQKSELLEKLEKADAA